MILHDDHHTHPHALGIAVDGLLLQAFATRTNFSSVETASIPFADLALAADCGAQPDPDCLVQIGKTLDADWILLRQLLQQADGELSLNLTLRCAQSGELRQAAGQTTTRHRSIAERVVPDLVDRLLGVEPNLQVLAAPRRAEASVVRDGARPAASRPERRSWWTIGGATALASGAGLLVGGFVVAALARHDRRDFARLLIETRDDVDHAEQLRARALQRMATARALWVSGGSLAALGAACLGWERIGTRRASDTQLAVAPTATGGVLVALSGVLRGGL